MKGKRIVICLLFILCFFKTYSYISVSPILFDKRIDNGGAVQEYYITNTLANKISYRIYLEEGKNDMSKWIEFYPKNLVLEAGATGKIKLFIEAPEEQQTGEYTAILGIKEINTPNIEREGNLSIYTNLKIEIAGFIGDLKPKLKIENLKLENNSISMEIENTGQIRTKAEVFLKNKNKEEYLGSIRLLKATKKLFSTKHSSEVQKGSKIEIRDLEGELIKSLDLRRENE
ncbi:hypothetical protein [Fusobacterium sp. SYSU M8D902]|uniref:hypothetical protein n=1 Tax=Fusobacterium sp. SYSU M8D902 TaxID=3159562 RepID=UPI0032E3D0B1